MAGLRGAIFPGFLLLAASAALDPSRGAAAPACTTRFTAAADGSFAQAGYDSTPARLARLAALTAERFAAAARRLCAAGVLRPADLKRFGRVVVQNGEGATEPLIYREPGMPPRTWVFQYAFQDGGPPAPGEFERALKCWKRPNSDGCEFND